jgi:UDP-N-acetylmuramate-alanine ligase
MAPFAVKMEPMFKSKGLVVEIMEYKGKFLVAFPTYAVLFQVDDLEMQEKIRKAYRDGCELSFAFDPHFKIVSQTDV